MTQSGHRTCHECSGITKLRRQITLVTQPSIEKIVYEAAQPDEATITCRSGIVHGKYIERLDFDRTVADQQSKVSRMRASQTLRHGCYQICMADGCERLEEQGNACDNVT